MFDLYVLACLAGVGAAVLGGTLDYLHLKICSKRVKFCLKV
jgi:hypothetical protein